MQNFNTPERCQVSTHVTCAIFHEYWEWGWASSSPAAHTPGRQSSPHPGPAEGCSPSLEFFQALSSTPELEGAQVHLLPPQPIQVRSIPHWPHLGWHCCLSKCQEKLGQNYHKLDLMETFFPEAGDRCKIQLHSERHWMKWKKQSPAAAFPWSVGSPQHCQFQTCVFLHPITSSCRNLYLYLSPSSSIWRYQSPL